MRAALALLLFGCSGGTFTAGGDKGGAAGMAGSAAGLGGSAGESSAGAGMASGGSPAGQGGMAAGSAVESAGGPATGGAGMGGESAAGGLGGALVAGAGQGGGSAGELAAGMGGMGGMGGAALPCDVREALQESCARVGCHRSPDPTSGLDLSQMDRIAEQVVDVHATHGGIACNGPGEPFRECTQEELTGCSWGAYRVDSQNFNDSWVVSKLMGNQGQCGGQMPQPPGNSEANGWSNERRACLLLYFESLTR